MQRLTPTIALLLYLLAAAPYERTCPGGACGLDQRPPLARPVMTNVPRSVLDATVQVQNWVSDAQHWDGSGTLVAKGNGRGLVVTCSHTFSDHGFGRPIVQFRDGARYEGRVLDHDPVLDVLVLEIAEPAAEPLALAGVAPQVGDAVRALGYGGDGNQLQCSPGNAVGYLTKTGGPEKACFTVSGGVPHGFSGGPMLDVHWKVCGVVFGTNGRVCDGVALPRLRAFLERWRARATFRRQQAPILNRPTAGNQPPANRTARNHPGNQGSQAQTGANRPPSVELPKKDAKYAEKYRQAAAELAKTKGLTQRLAEQLGGLENRLAKVTAQRDELVSATFDRTTPPVPGLSPIGQVAQRAGSAALKKMLIGAGVASPIAAFVAWLLTWIVLKRAKKKLAGSTSRRSAAVRSEPSVRTVTEPAPAQPMAIDERHNTQFVEVPDNTKDKAWARAIQIMGGRYPGYVAIFESLEALKNQILKGEPTDGKR